MAYGLYDQAADLVRTAIKREPERRDLKLKLVEVYFVWGNRDEFLATARELHQTRTQAAAGEWDKIMIMGRQIAPEDPLFSGAPGSSAAATDLDLDLHPGEAKLDFDLLGEGHSSGLAGGAAAIGAASLAGASSLDLNFSDQGTSTGNIRALDDLAEKTASGDTTAFAPSYMDPALDRSGGTTREMAPQFPGSAPSANDLTGDLGEAPTVEQPALRTNSPTIRQKIDAVLRQANTANDQTAEVAIDDLGLELGDGLDLDDPQLTATGQLPAVAGDTVELPRQESSADTPTLVAGLDAESRRLMDVAAEASGADSAATGDWFTGTKTERDTSATASMSALDVDLSEHIDTSSTAQFVAPKDLDIDLERLTATGEVKGPALNGAAAAAQSDELSLPALEPMTISEVGTKLDLARAYMDMGDPDGARSILKEVLHEGSVSQKQEAQRLIDSLPG
jgi:pilus assembly protein FimV